MIQCNTTWYVNTIVQYWNIIVKDLRNCQLYKLGGLSERNLSVDAARTDQYTYALVYIRRDDLKDLYAKQEQKLHREINRILEKAQSCRERT